MLEGKFVNLKKNSIVASGTGKYILCYIRLPFLKLSSVIFLNKMFVVSGIPSVSHTFVAIY